MASYESFYNGGISTFDKSYGAKENYGTFLGTNVYAGSIGSPTGIQTANQLKEVISRIKEGVKNVELQPLQDGVFDQIPKQHFAEMKALMKLTGVNPSLHAPIIDPSGFEQQRGYSDENRIENERRLFSAVEKAHMLDHKGNIPVVIHSSAGVPGTEYKAEKGEGGASKWHAVRMGVFDQEKKQFTGVEEERILLPGITKEEWDAGGKIKTPESRINMINESQWDQQFMNLSFYGKHFSETMNSVAKYGSAGFESDDPALQQEMQSELSRAGQFLESNQLSFNKIWETVGKYGSSEQKEALWNLSEQYKKENKEVLGPIMLQKKKLAEEENLTPSTANQLHVQELLVSDRLMQQTINRMKEITQGVNPFTGERDDKWGAPKIMINAEDFQRKKAAETLGNVAWKGYNELGGDKAPVIAIENMFMGMANPRAEDMKKLIDMSRDKFVENAKKNGMDKDGAEKAAEKLIGVNWDVGHLNIIKKHGFTDKDIQKETEKIAPYVKHVHLTDNFGYGDSHLAPGMGNVPFKQILETLEKKGDMEGVRKIVEAGAFVQHFQKSPHAITMAALGSPIYGAKMGPTWNQTASMPSAGGYFGFPYAQLPEKHFSMYGSGFSSLPEELGGQIPGTQSRFSGAPNA